MTLEQLAAWLERYRRAWEDRDPDAAAELFAEAARYWWGPFEAPLSGREEIRDRWAAATAGQEKVRFAHEPLAVTPDGRGVARWWVTYRAVASGADVRDEGIFLITLDGSGRCVEFREWWNEVEPRGRVDDTHPWNDASWHEQAQAWIRHRVGASEIEQWAARPWSTILRARAEGGPVYFKANIPALAHEARLLERVHGLAPELAPQPLAADHARGWLLLPDAGLRLREVIRADRDLGHWEALLRRYAALQLAAVERADDLLAAGALDRRASTLPGQLADLAASRPEGLAAEELAALARAAPRFADDCAALAASGLPETLYHDDLHDGNVFVGAGGHLVLDWAESCIGHPLLGLGLTLDATAWSLGLDEGGAGIARLRAAYLDCWTHLAPRAELVATLTVAERVRPVARALTWHLVASEAPVAGEDRGAVATLLRRFLAAHQKRRPVS